MNESLKLTELISVDTLQRIQDAFATMTGMAALTTDADGIPITRGSNFTEFCMKHVRDTENGHIRCEQCDRFGAEESWKCGKSSYYYCHAGLIDFAAPILADNQMIGSFIGGQILTKPLEKEQVYEIAWELGIDPEVLWESSKKILITDEQGVDDAAQFLFTVANVLSDMAYGNYRVLQANREIERANSMKSDFLANMSHEIRTPMNAVIGMAEMALREVISPIVREYLYQIKSSGKALLTIINDILDFSKIESGKMDIIPVEYEPMSIVNDVANIAVERLDDKEVELILDISPDLPAVILGDNIRIKQILLNLVNNAVKFTNVGQVIVSVRHTYIESNKIMLHFDVEDTGIGIKEKDLKSIFDSFMQADSKRNRNIEGTGLGLAISRQLVLLMGGRINVTSQYGNGSVFSFEIPQEVISHEPSCALKNANGIQAMGLIKNHYVKKNLAMDCERLGVSYKELANEDEISIADGKKCFVFIEKELFTDELKEYIKSTPKLTAIILYHLYEEIKDYDIPNILMVRKPLFSINEVNIFNGEDLYSSYTDNEVLDISFTAPTAKVLVVDDNITNLVVTEGLLAPLRMQIDTVTGGREAIEKISVESYDIIFMDHMMPDMDGVETTHIIREKFADYRDVPIIALTANAMSGIKEMFIKQGMSDFVSKPIEVKNLIKTVAKWLPPEKMEKVDASMEEQPEEENTLFVGDLDTEMAISLLGSKKLYLTILENYYNMIEKNSGRIRELYENEDWENYTIEVHSLKSTSRQIGATALSEQAYALEMAGKEGDIELIRENTDMLLEKYESYLSVLSPLFVTTEELETKGEIEKNVLLGLFDMMRDAMDELDMDRMEEVSARLKEYTYSGSGQEYFERFIEAAANLDVTSCEEVMSEWQQNL